MKNTQFTSLYELITEVEDSFEYANSLASFLDSLEDIDEAEVDYITENNAEMFAYGMVVSIEKDDDKIHFAVMEAN